MIYTKPELTEHIRGRTYERTKQITRSTRNQISEHTLGTRKFDICASGAGENKRHTNT